MQRFDAALLIVACTALPAAAQIGNPAGMQPSTPETRPGVPAPGHPNTQDRLFVQLAGAGNLAEVQAARLADSKARNDDTKRLARHMVQDHTAANERLEALAQRSGIPMPTDVAPEHRAMRERLEAIDGATFDLEYLRGQLVDHQKTVQLLQWHLSFGQEAELLRFSAALLPQILQHLEMVQVLLSGQTGTPPQGLAAAAGAAPR
ncbi:MAG: DUF4142 domain-containing protein [Burkholderiaceae bacterium]|nr:DUF4142 domain-containing protein [Burkholderiaceae bacterium]